MSRTLLNAQHIQDICPRFRVLVIGRRNAGKTTILKKMSGSDGNDVEIRDIEGKKVDPSILQPTSTRGMSEIENEITFRSNPLFVFHDSRGIEAGADTEENSPLRPDYLWNFLEKRSKASKIRDQVHVVWFCIPMDKPRVPSEEFELSFFNGRRSPVPVIAVFTKFESLVDEAYNNLPDDDTSEEDREDQANQDAQSKFEKTALRAVQGTQYPPHQFVQLQQLNEPTGECIALTKKTNAALQNETLLNIFALAQHNSFEVGCQRVFRLMISDGPDRMAQMQKDELMRVIGYLRVFIPSWRFNLPDRDSLPWDADSLPWDDDDDSYDLNYMGVSRDHLPHVVHSIEAFVDSLFGNEPDIVTDTLRYLSVITVACIIFVSTGNKSRQPFTLVGHTIKLLKQNEQFAESISTSVAEACSKFPEESEVHKLIDWLVGIVMEHVESIRAL